MDWILMEEKRPSRRGWYILTILSGRKKTTTVGYWMSKEHYFTQFDESENGGYLEVLNVIAYSKLPDPLKQENG